MSEVNKSQVAAGVINFGEVVVTQDKKFKPREEFNNLCQAHLVSVEIKETETPKVDENGVASTYEYAGIPVPTIVFRYKEEVCRRMSVQLQLQLLRSISLYKISTS